MATSPAQPAPSTETYPPRRRLGPGDPLLSAALARTWWAMALRGAVAILAGVLALAAPAAALLSLALLFAGYLVVDGVLGLVCAARATAGRRRWGLLLAEAALGLVTAVLVILAPAGAILGFVIAAAAWSFATGVLLIASAFTLTRPHGRWWMALAGLVSIVFSAGLVLYPIIGALVLSWWFAFYAIAFGIFLLILSLQLRAQRGREPPASAPAGAAG